MRQWWLLSTRSADLRPIAVVAAPWDNADADEDVAVAVAVPDVDDGCHDAYFSRTSGGDSP